MDINKLCPGCMKEIENREFTSVCPHCGYDLKSIHNEIHQLQPFSILNGKYMVGKVIGQGGFGITYVGFDLNLEIVVAIKEFYPDGFVTRDSTHATTVSSFAGKNQPAVEKWAGDFLKEARSLAKFTDLTGIVQVRDFFKENSTVYLAMEYIDGIDMKEYLKQQGGKIAADKVFQLMEPIIQSLSKVHAEGIIHRDISPDNIMLMKNGGIKLLDFGAARNITSNVERSQTILLKHGYAPEEQYRSRGNLGTWTDVYALCATIYKCITGVTPIEAQERMRNDELLMPSQLGIAINPVQEEALKHGLAVYAENRIQNMDDLYSALYEGQTKTIIPKDEGMLSNLQLDKKETIKINTPFIIVGGTVAVFILILAVAISGLSSSRTKKEPVEANAPTEQRTDAEAPIIINNDLEDINQMVEESSGKIADGHERGEAMQSLKEAIEKYRKFQEDTGEYEPVNQGIQTAMEYYCDAVIQQSSDLIEQEVQVEIYHQIAADLNDALTYGEELINAGYDVDLSEISQERGYLDEIYKRMYIEEFNEFINQYQWAQRENEKFIREGYELFPTEDINDPLRLRYAYGKAWLTHWEIENGFKDGTMNYGDIVKHVENVLEEIDYCEFIIQEAEHYALISGEGWINEKYYDSPWRDTIIADSSTREYTVDELRNLGLNSAELRYARYEIYARHGMTMLWDQTANEILAAVNKNSAVIPCEKFMSYNDFGVYSTDGVNGLTNVERQNVRNIVKLQLDNGMWIR